VNPFDDRVLRDDTTIGENGAFGVEVADETASLELREEPELTDL
jgi:hypothetical protein